MKLLSGLFVVTTVAALMGCMQASSQSTVETKVADVRHDVARKEVAALEKQARTEAAADTDELTAVQKAESRKAGSAYDVAVTEAEGRYKIERAQCDGIQGDSRQSCLEHADTALAQSMSEAETSRKAAGG